VAAECLETVTNGHFYRGNLESARAFVRVHDAAEAGMRLLRRVAHPCIVTAYGVVKVRGRDGVKLGVAHEALEGWALREMISQRRMLLKDEIDVGLCVAMALLHMPRGGVLHGDIKQDVVFVLEGGGAKIIDLMAASVRGIRAGGSDWSEAADVWAWGRAAAADVGEQSRWSARNGRANCQSVESGLHGDRADVPSAHGASS
jgi:hypothetical protein